MNKTLTELKRELKVGTKLKVLYHAVNPHTEGNIKTITKTQTNAIYTVCEQDSKNEEIRLELPTACLLEYVDDVFVIYEVGARELNEQEKAIMNEWKELENKPENIKQSEIDMLSDGSTMFYKKKSFFNNKGFSYLMGFDEEKGCKYDFNTKQIRDKSIKGTISMQYVLVK